ncbi:MAG: tRNA (adenosine(37)-N6)-threonylcarbamoyltransferase complex transferase subunit TsaD [Peptococcaceae bacterium]|nr:tRNA (adenosine(37)-N6)-threonylcarbamoyltransferase complex transferase subunit TsaD [Peptococcaceae bacterium]
MTEKIREAQGPEFTWIMAVESSCDETAVAILKDGKTLAANVVASQIPVHQAFGGVVPEIASRQHMEVINRLVEEALKEAGIGLGDLEGIVVAKGPGLVGALLVGVSTAKALAYSLDIPLLGVNHMEGHIYANWLSHGDIQFPLLGLIVSGGHTALMLLEGHGSYRLLGQTRDDAAGEAYDKVARAMGLGYPGGPLIDGLALDWQARRQAETEAAEREAAVLAGEPAGGRSLPAEGDAAGKSRISERQVYQLPRAYLEPGSWDFSFSGLKTAVLNILNQAKMQDRQVDRAALAAAFQDSVTGVLTDKTLAAAKALGCRQVLLAGGVAANRGLRQRMGRACAAAGLTLYYPEPHFCTDNAAMVAAAGYYRLRAGQRDGLTLNAFPSLGMEDM